HLRLRLRTPPNRNPNKRSCFMTAIPMILYGEECKYKGETGELGRVSFDADFDEKIATCIKELAQIRKSYIALSEGNLRWVYAGTDAVAYVRFTVDEMILVYISRGGTSLHTVVLDGLTVSTALVISGDRFVSFADNVFVFDGKPGYSYVKIDYC
ncbi:hypothetical protein NSA19_13585, partial [Actinomyces bowdenii]|uniref:hypothetical protein n=1 Tax=Actinomyces bowdenii TaxID=131109 RepID=UPI00214B49B6